MHWRKMSGRVDLQDGRSGSGRPRRGHRGSSLLIVAALTLTALPADDWPMLGGRPERTNVSPEKGLPIAWDGGAAKKNIKWTADLGDVTYGSPVISSGRVFIGTNNDDPSTNQKRGVLKCFSEKDGRLLWRV